MRPLLYPGDKAYVVLSEETYSKMYTCSECNDTGKVRYKQYLVTCPVCHSYKEKYIKKRTYKVISVKIETVTIYETFCSYMFLYQGRSFYRVESAIFLTEEGANEALKEIIQQ